MPPLTRTCPLGACSPGSRGGCGCVRSNGVSFSSTALHKAAAKDWGEGTKRRSDWPAGALAPRTRWRRRTPSTWTRRNKRTSFSRVKGVLPAGSLRRQDPETHLRKSAICGVTGSASLRRPWHPSIANFLSRKPERTSLWSMPFLSRLAILTGDIKYKKLIVKLISS